MLTYNFSPWYYGFKRPKFGPMQSEGRLFIPVHFLKLTLMRLLIYISVISMMISCSPRKEHGEPINILFIMTDQHRGDCIGSAGAHWLATPNLDALASEGVLFSNAYVSVPSCLPVFYAFCRLNRPPDTAFLFRPGLPEQRLLWILWDWALPMQTGYCFTSR